MTTTHDRPSAAQLLKRSIAHISSFRRPGTRSAFPFRFGSERVLVLRMSPNLIVLGRTIEGRFRARSFVDRAADSDEPVAIAAAERMWTLAKEDRDDIFASSRRLAQPYRVQSGLGSTLRKIGLLSAPQDVATSSEHSAVLEDIAQVIDLDALFALDRIDPAHTGSQYDWVSNPVGASDRKALIEAYPYAARMLSRHGDQVDARLVAGTSHTEIVLDTFLSAGRIPLDSVATRSARARVVGMIEKTVGISRKGFDGPAAFLKLGLSIERIPRDTQEWLAFDELHGLAKISAAWTSNLRDLMDIPKGEYGKLLDRIRKTRLGKAITSPDGSLSQRAFRIGRAELPSRATDLMALPLAVAERGFAAREHLIVAMDQLFFRDKSLFGVVETMDQYHTDNHVLTEAVARVASGRGITWRPPMKKKEFSSGKFDFVWLTTPDELIDEGVEGLDRNGMAGLNHCVGGYVTDCMEGRSFILSIRRKVDGRQERVATAEFSLDRSTGDANLVQISGRGNAEVPLDVEGAAEKIRSVIGINGASNERAVDSATTGRSAVGLVKTTEEIEIVRAALSKFLPRHMRDCSLSEFFATVAELEAAAADPDDRYQLVPMPGR